MMIKNTDMIFGPGLVAITMAVWLSTFGTSWGQEEAILKNAEVILVGTVKGMGIANWDVKPNARTVIVHVDEIIRPTGNTPLNAYEGRSVTIELLKAGSIPAGRRATFYTRLWSLGQGLALIELGHTLEPQSRAAAGDSVAAASSAVENKIKAAQLSDLSARIAAAGMVVVGRVTEIENQQPERQRARWMRRSA